MCGAPGRVGSGDIHKREQAIGIPLWPAPFLGVRVGFRLDRSISLDAEYSFQEPPSQTGLLSKTHPYILWPGRTSLVAPQQHAYSHIGDIGTDSDPCFPLPHHRSPLYGPKTHSPSQLPVSDLPVYRHSNGRFPVTPRQLRHTLGTERADKLDVLVLQEGSK